MRITVKLFATLREGRFISKEMEYADGAIIRQVVDDLSIDHKDAAIIFVNSRHAPLDRELCDGDILALFPAIGGG